jgi:hypothetical protein
VTCRELIHLLSEGLPLSQEANEHIRQCSNCRALSEIVGDASKNLDPQALQRVEATLLPSLRPVRPLPSDTVLIFSLFALFIGFSILAALPVGLGGLHTLSLQQKVLDYSAIALCALCLAYVVVKYMIPGSRKRFGAAAGILFTVLFLFLLTTILFPDMKTDHFVGHGIYCLRFGCLCAAGAGLLTWLVVRRGLSTSPVAAGATCGFFAGLTGVAVLALHCPVLEAPHILVWHFGAMMLAGLSGALIGLSSHLLSK